MPPLKSLAGAIFKGRAIQRAIQKARLVLSGARGAKKLLRLFKPAFRRGRGAVLSLFLAYIFIAHVILPLTNTSHFLFFSRWDMFSGYHSSFSEISWVSPDTKTPQHFFRDHLWSGRAAGINAKLLFHLAFEKDIQRLKKYFSKSLRGYCKCESVRLVVFQGALSSHIFYRESLPVIEEFEL